MSDEFSVLQRVTPQKDKAQWVQAKYLRTETGKNGEEVMVMGVPYLMPGTIIFVHGVNSEGEWYEPAARQFCTGLNKRLGRQCLQSPSMNKQTMRFGKQASDGTSARSPIIPFYWGYKLQPGDESRYPGIFNGDDGAWGGGPFQNGTNNLLQFWQGGFKRKVLNGMIDLQRINSDITRQLQDAPPRAYFVHAAKRLANLIDTIREDFPNEPLNIVSHSQGNMITMCAMLYLKRRAPDTLLLNSAPYSFDVKITDWLAAANGWSDVQSTRARMRTFEAVVRKVAMARTDYKDDEANVASPTAASGQVSMHMHHEPQCDDWHGQIGKGQVNHAGQCWNDCKHAGRDNRGKVFVNFNPHDRVIGIAAVEGIGWRGIPEHIMGEGRNPFPNVYQRVFARNSGVGQVPAVGAKTNYWFRYFHTQMNVAEDVKTESGTVLTTADGTPVRTVNDYDRTFDDKPASRFWNVLPQKVAGLFGVQSTPGLSERVWINAPTVPEPARIGDKFDQGATRFDGNDDDEDAADQKQEFATYHRHYVIEKEKPEQVEGKLANYGKQMVPKTNHGTILQYGSRPWDTAELVTQVLSYDLTVGQGYAYGDPDYWQYLIKLADWKESDPYYSTGILSAPGPCPKGLDTETVAPKVTG